MLLEILVFLNTFFAFLFGTVIGSFLNVVIDRLPRGESIAHGRSHCDHCRKTLAWYDLIPLFSYLFLWGKCRYCHKKIPQRLFVVEFVIGILCAVIYVYTFSNSLSFPYFIYVLFLLFIFTAIFSIDIKFGIIPDILTIILLMGVAVYTFIFTPTLFIPHLITGVVSFAFFLFLALITKGKGMGFGDVKLSFVLGFLLGFPLIIVAFYLSFLTGAVISIILILWKKKRLRHTIPFGPFLVAGTFVSVLFGEKIIVYALQFFT